MSDISYVSRRQYGDICRFLFFFEKQTNVDGESSCRQVDCLEFWLTRQSTSSLLHCAASLICRFTAACRISWCCCAEKPRSDGEVDDGGEQRWCVELQQLHLTWTVTDTHRSQPTPAEHNVYTSGHSADAVTQFAGLQCSADPIRVLRWNPFSSFTNSPPRYNLTAGEMQRRTRRDESVWTAALCYTRSDPSLMDSQTRLSARLRTIQSHNLVYWVRFTACRRLLS